MRRISLIVAAVLVVVLGATACERTDEPADGVAAPAPTGGATASTYRPMTAWDKVVDQVGPRGQVSAETAVAAFSLAYAPLPGAEIPTGPTEEIPSGTTALRWLYGAWGELTAEQRRAAAPYLPVVPGDTTLGTGGDGVPPSARGCRTDDSKTARTLEGRANELVGIVGDRMDVEPEFELAITVSDKASDAWFDASPATAGCLYRPGKIAYCTIRLFEKNSAGTTEIELRAALAHEVIHCFQEQLLDVTGWERVPSWIIEGQAEWGGLDIEPKAGRIAGYWWWKYLLTPERSLFARTYDALGFYARLAETEANPWDAFVPMLRDAAGGASAPAFDDAVGLTDPTTFLDDWPAGYFRDGGHPWDVTGVGITDDRPSIAVHDEGSFPKVSNPVANLVDMVNVKSEVIHASGDFGRFMDAEGAEHLLSGMAGIHFCTLPGGCECPEDSPNADAEFEPMAPGVARVALTGGLAQGRMDLDGMTLEEFCASCPVGVWQATGVTFPSGNGISLTGGAGTLFTLTSEGEAVWDLNPSAQFVGRTRDPSIGLVTVQARLRGRLTGTVEVGERTLGFDLRGRVTETSRAITPGKTPWNTVGIGGAPRSARYTCSGDELTVTATWRGSGVGTWKFARADGREAIR